MELIDLLGVGLLQTFSLWNRQYLQSIMNGSAVMACAWTPIYITRLCHPTKEEGTNVRRSRRGRKVTLILTREVWNVSQRRWHSNWTFTGQIRGRRNDEVQSSMIWPRSESVLYPSILIASKPPSDHHRKTWCTVKLRWFCSQLYFVQKPRNEAVAEMTHFSHFA